MPHIFIDRRYRLFLLAAWLLIAVLPVQSDELQDFSNSLEKNIELTELSNGLKVLWYRRGFAPVFSGALAVRVGGVNEELGQTGLSHMLEHMAFKGTPDIGTRDYERELGLLQKQRALYARLDSGEELSAEEQQELEQISKSLKEIWIADELSQQYRIRGASDLNATTSQDLTTYFVSLPRPQFEYFCFIESERIVSPVFRQFYEERDVVQEERRMRYDDRPSGRLYEQLLLRAFLQHPYRHPVIGYQHDIARLQPDKLKELHDAFYVPSNMVLALVGDVDPERDLPVVEKYFGRIPARPGPDHPTVVEPPWTGTQRFEVPYPASPQMVVAYQKPSYPHPDDAALSVLFEMIGGSNIAPLYAELVKKLQIATSASYFEAPGSAYPNLVVFSLVPRQEASNDRLLKAFQDLISSFPKHYLTKERLNIAKRAIRKSLYDRADSNLGLARDLASTEVLYGNWKESLRWYEQISQIELDDVERAFEQYLLNAPATIGVLERS